MLYTGGFNTNNKWAFTTRAEMNDKLDSKHDIVFHLSTIINHYIILPIIVHLTRVDFTQIFV